MAFSRTIALFYCLPFLIQAAACSDDGGDDGPSQSTANGDSETGSPTPAASSETTAAPTTETTTGNDPDSTSGDTPGTTAADGTTGPGPGEGTTTGSAGSPVWALDVDIELGGMFPVTVEYSVTIDGGSFDADVLTVTIAGQPEQHVIPLAGTVDGNTLTLTDSMFTLVVGRVSEEVSVSGTAELSADDVTGSGTFTTLVKGGQPQPGTWLITGATRIE